jgi:hypothetical protein
MQAALPRMASLLGATVGAAKIKAFQANFFVHIIAQSNRAAILQHRKSRITNFTDKY